MRHSSFRWFASLTGLAVGLGAQVVLSSAPSSADTQPPQSGVPATVSADALPTWQINGVVWSQVVVGSTVYAVGSFTKARPPGTATGDPAEVNAQNIFAFDINTGNRVSSFDHTLNAQGRFITKSPDGSRIYVGGDFTSVDGQARGHVVAFDTATGALVPNFAPNVNGNVRSVQATNSTVYVGGAFTTVGVNSRVRLAAFRASDGALLPWSPSADDDSVWAMTLTPDSSKLVLGGAFSTLSGQPAIGMGAVDATSGAVQPWAATSLIRNAGVDASITSLRADANQIYGTAFSWDREGTIEGTFALDPATGVVNWLDNCHGDSYDTFPMGQVLYHVTHAHDCIWTGDLPETNPRTWNWLLASTTYPRGVNVGPDNYGWDHSGVPAATKLHFFPKLAAGTYTGQGQAGWSLTGNNDYLVVGGEFTQANFKAQQGLVRYARVGLAPNKRGMENFNADVRAVSNQSGVARVTWKSQWDMDNANIRYDVFRDGGATPVHTVTGSANPWYQPRLAFNDIGLPAGSQHTYVVKASDPFGNNSISPPSAPVTISSAASLGTYANGVLDDGAAMYWRLGESSGSTLVDSTGVASMTGSNLTRGVGGAVPGDTATTLSSGGLLSGASTAATSTAVPAPVRFSVETWMKTSSSSGGRIVGFSSSRTGTSSSADRHIYVDSGGRLVFGVNNSSRRTVRSTATYRDNVWHHVVGTLGPNGMSLYVDGKRVGYDSSVRMPTTYAGYWRLGGDTLSNWPSRPSSDSFSGTVDEVAVYDKVLSAATIQKHYIDSGRALPVPPVPPDAYGQAVYNDDPDLYWRLAEPTGTTANDSGKLFVPGTYTSTGVTKGVAGVIPGNAAVRLDGLSGSIGAGLSEVRPTVYSTELWFKTDTTLGGKLIGFGTSASGSSTTSDRFVYMTNAGKLRFGVKTLAGDKFAESAASYNNNAWHHVVATQSHEGLQLYVDGALVASDARSNSSQTYTGFWRAGGGDSNFGGSTRAFFTGTIDEVAVYSKALTVAQVQDHFTKGGGTVPNQPPTAAFTSSTNQLTVSFNGSGSTDPDGTIASYSWNFGDETPAGSGVSPQHTYASGGTYNVTLTVTDNSGATSSVSHPVSAVAPPPNQPPTAAFTTSITNETVSFNGSGSFDADGNITAYSWDFGDDTPAGSGVSPQHTYPGPGTYPVTLTVTDDGGATGSITHHVVISGVVTPVLLAEDGFERTVNNGWGSASTGGPWTTSGSANNFAVEGTLGTLRMSAGGGPSVFLNGVGSNDTDLFVELSLDKVPVGGTAGVDQGVLVRRIAGQGDYRAKLRVLPGGAVRLGLSRTDAGGAQTSLVAETTLPGVTYALGDVLRVRVRASGTSPTTLRARVWKAGTAEPNDWTVSATDSTAAMQTAGAIGFHSFLGGTVTNGPVKARFDNLAVYKASTLVENQAPVAAFTSSLTNLTATFDGSTSFDPDGPIASYAWNFGDGSPAGSGVSPQHTYAAAGSYDVTLTVTDVQGATGSVTQTISVNAAPPPMVLASDAFERTVVNGWGAADLGGSWTINGNAANFAVQGGLGTLRMPSAGTGPSVFLPGLSSSDTALFVSYSLDASPTGGTLGVDQGVLVRRVAGSGDYRARVRMVPDGTISLGLYRTDSGGGQTAIVPEATVPGLTYTAGDDFKLRIEAFGTSPTTLRAKIWRAGATEPTLWNVSATDSTAALQAAGGIGFHSFLAGTVTNAPIKARFDDLVVYKASTLP